MGEVKAAVHGVGDVDVDEDSLVARIRGILDEIDELVRRKDDDTVREKGQEIENTRKASTLRATATLMTAAVRLLEDY